MGDLLEIQDIDGNEITANKQKHEAYKGTNPGDCPVKAGQAWKCTNDTDCQGKTRNGADTLRCDSTNKKCVECLGQSDCPENLICSGEGECIECNSDTPCNSAARPYCVRSARTGKNECVECLSHGDCSGDKPACNPVSNRCEICTSDNKQMCNTSNPGCRIGRNGEENKCVICTGDSHCSGNRYCDTDVNYCTDCKTDDHCIRKGFVSGPGTGYQQGQPLRWCVKKPFDSAYTEFAGKSRLRCVSCRSDADCPPSAEPAFQNHINCHEDSGFCVVCKDDSDCTDSNNPACSQRVNYQTGSCVRCTNSSHCQGKRRYVNDFGYYQDTSGSGYKEVSTPACRVRGQARDNSCVQCVTGQDCQNENIKIKIYDTNGNLTEVPAKGCDRNICVACASSGDCIEPNKGLCFHGEVSGTRYGQCIQCSKDQHCEGAVDDHGNSAPKCWTRNLRPPRYKCVQCYADSHCSDRTDGKTVCGNGTPFTCTLP